MAAGSDGAAHRAISMHSVHSEIGPETKDEDTGSFDLTPSPGQNRKRRPGATSRRPSGGPRSNSLPMLRGKESKRGMTDPGRNLALDVHSQFSPHDGSLEARVLNLERQANYDHGYLQNVQTSFNTILDILGGQEDKNKEYTTMGMQLRRELYTLRDTNNLELKKVQDGVVQNVREVADKVLAPAIEQILTQRLADTAAALKDLEERNAKAERYLEALHGQRPQEGQQVVQTFLQMGQEVKSVKEMVQALEAKVPGLSKEG